MTIPAGLTAELDLLTQALDLPGPDLAETLIRLTADAQTAVDSYLGLSIAINANRTEFDLTILKEGTQPEHVRTSLLVPLSTAAADPSTAPASVAMILYAAAPGAFIDLAADLSWTTGRTLGDFRLDEHHTFPVNATNPTAVGTMSSINQALGVLIGRGSTPEQAERDLHGRAARAGIELLAVATLILAALTSPADQAGCP